MMALFFVCLAAAVTSAFGRGRPALRSTKLHVYGSDLDSYSFDKFLKDFDRPYAAGTDEYHQRASLFQVSLKRIQQQNAKEKKSWIAGPHAFMDWTQQELRSMQGYKPSQHQRHSRHISALQASSTISRSWSRLNLSIGDDDEYIGQGTTHRSQGQCGSCWAISSAEAVEAQLKRSGKDVQVSAQALVDCVPNPQHCGGTGGCDGATGELAFQFMQQHGIPLESELPYRKSSSFGGPSQELSACKLASSATYPSKVRVTVDGWESKPSNQAAGLLQAITEYGSAVVAVDANDWFDYHSGVYDGCSKDATLVHAVLAKGFGKDKSSGKKYWLIQNSWSTGWGEGGDIRLLRHDKDDDWCGTDKSPQKGVGCDDGPPEVSVCGMCGILYDAVVPTGVRLVNDDDVGSLARASAGDYTPWHP